MKATLLTLIAALIFPLLSVSENNAAISDDLTTLTMEDYNTFENNRYEQSEYETQLAEIKKETELYNRLFYYAVIFIVLVSIFALYVFWNVCEVYSFFKNKYLQITGYFKANRILNMRILITRNQLNGLLKNL